MAEARGGTVRRSLLLSFAGRYGAMPMRLAAMLALARLLSPAEFGVYATAAAAVGLCAVLTDLGLGQYLVQAPKVTEADRRAALGLGLALGTGTAALLGAVAVAALLAPGDEGWLSEELSATLAVQALTLPLQPVAAVAGAGLQRALRFGPIAAAGVAGAAAFTGIAVAGAALGLGPVALSLGTVAEALLVAALLSRRQGARLPRPALRGWRPVFGFGWVWSAIAGLRQAGDALSRLLMGGLLGLGALGLFSRAQAVVQVFDKALLDAVSPVVLPALSAAQRAGRPLAPAYLRQVACLAALAWPFFGALALLAGPVVALLLGRGWEGAVPAVRWLALGGLALPLGGLVLPYLVALGAMRAWLPMQAWLQGGRVLGVALAAAAGSLQAACAAFAAEQVAKAILAQRLLARGLGWQVTRGAVRALALSAPPALAVLAAAAAVAFAPATRDLPPVLLLPLAAAAALPAWLLALAALRHPLHAELVRGIAVMRDRLRGGGAAAAAPAGPAPATQGRPP